MNQRRSVLVAPLLLALGMSFAHAADDAKRGLGELAGYQGADREAVLLKGAKTEAPLTLYYTHQLIGRTIVESFEKKYGLKVNHWRANNESIMQRVYAENQAGKNQVDVFFGSLVDMELARRNGLLEPVNAPALKYILPEAMAQDKSWATFTLDVWMLGYNPKLIPKEELPKSYEDLLNPKWKGKLGIEGGNYQWYGALLESLGEEKGRKLFEQITATNGIAVRTGHSLLASMVASGEVPLALTLYSWNPGQLNKRGAPIESAVLRPLIGHGGAAGIAKKAKNPHAAVLFYDFMFEEGQQILLDAGYVPMSNKFDLPVKRETFRFLDPRHTIDNQDRWMKAFQNDILNRSR
jgi:iron(III) transport system substrate-binding protein